MDHGVYGFLTAVNCADGVVQIVRMKGKINVAGLDEKSERLVVPGGQDSERRLGHLSQRRLFDAVGRLV